MFNRNNNNENENFAIHVTTGSGQVRKFKNVLIQNLTPDNVLAFIFLEFDENEGKAVQGFEVFDSTPDENFIFGGLFA